MGTDVRRISYPSGEPSESFMRKVRNFMQNWSISGGSFYFDGYRVNLNIDKLKDESQWEITKKTALVVNVKAGIVTYWDATNEQILFAKVGSATLEMTSSGTNYIYLRSTMTPAVFGTYNIAWVASELTLVTDATELANTVDFSDAVTGSGYMYTPLGEVVTDGTEITSDGITQLAFNTIPLDVSFTLNLKTFACPSP